MLIEIPKEVFSGKALIEQSDQYPHRYNGKVPLRVRLLKDVQSDLPSFIKPVITLLKGGCYFVSVNSHGAVSAILEDGSSFGLKPNEFEICWWHE